jgi:hypothetical protein
MQELLDRLLDPMMPGSGFIYLPYTKWFMIAAVSGSIILLYYFFRKAVYAAKWIGLNRPRTLLLVMATITSWCLSSSLVGAMGITDGTSSVSLITAMMLPVFGIIVLSRNKAVVKMLDLMPDAILINAQLFRLFFEPVTFLLFIEDYVPLHVTLEGSNPEMMVAVSAPVLIAMFFNDDIKRYWIAIIWNFCGLASLSYFAWSLLDIPPDPEMYWTSEPPMRIFSAFPFILYLTFYIPVAFGLHLLSIRQLLRDRLNPIKYDISYLEPEIGESE